MDTKKNMLNDNLINIGVLAASYYVYENHKRYEGLSTCKYS